MRFSLAFSIVTEGSILPAGAGILFQRHLLQHGKKKLLKGRITGGAISPS